MIESKLHLEGDEDRGAVELTSRTQNYPRIGSPERSKKGNRYLNKHTSQVGLNSFQSGACYPSL